MDIKEDKIRYIITDIVFTQALGPIESIYKEDGKLKAGYGGHVDRIDSGINAIISQMISALNKETVINQDW